MYKCTYLVTPGDTEGPLKGSRVEGGGLPLYVAVAHELIKAPIDDGRVK